MKAPREVKRGRIRYICSCYCWGTCCSLHVPLEVSESDSPISSCRAAYSEASTVRVDALLCTVHAICTKDMSYHADRMICWCRVDMTH